MLNRARRDTGSRALPTGKISFRILQVDSVVFSTRRVVPFNPKPDTIGVVDIPCEPDSSELTSKTNTGSFRRQVHEGRMKYALSY